MDINDVSSWKGACGALETKIDATERRLNSHRGKTEREKRAIKIKIQECQGEVDTLDRSYTQFSQHPSNYRLTDYDISSMKDRLDRVKSKIVNLEESVNKNEENIRTALLADNRTRNVRDSAETVALTNKDLYQEQLQRREKEDEDLDKIGDGLAQLNVIATRQNHALRTHEHMLDDLNQTVNATDTNMQMNIKRVDYIEERSRGGWIPFIFMVLIMILIVIAVASDVLCSILPNTKKRCK